MPSIELSPEELEVVRAALHAYRDTSGHDEADTLRLVDRVCEKVDAGEEAEQSAEAAIARSAD
jgi:hypothetical protein